MGILSRFIAVIRANLNSMINRAEDPTKMLEQALIDMDTAYRKAKDQVARAIADQKRLEKSLADQQRNVKKWNERAVIAVEKNDDNLAKEALLRKQEHGKIAAQYSRELEAHTINIDTLKSSLRELESKIEEIRRKKHLLISKQKRAEAQDQIYKTIEGVQSAGAIDTIQRMEEKIEDMSSLADARLEMSNEFQGDVLEKKFSQLEGGGDDINAELLELKQQMKLENKS